MIASPLAHFSSVALRHLLEPAARSLVLASVAALALAVFRVRNVSLRLAVWTGVLYAALAMPFLGLLPGLPLPLPGWRAATGPAESATLASPARIVDERAHALAGQQASAPAVATTSPSSRRVIPWAALAVGVYLIVALVFLARLAVGIALSRRLRRASSPIGDIAAVRVAAWHANVTGLLRAPRLAESAAVAVPVTLGALRPMILLPATWREWDERKLRAVIAHEISHVARRDPLTQFLSALHWCCFWFSPLGWWLDRRLTELAEEASDDAALGAGADRELYATLLIGFFENLQAARARVDWQGVSMARGSRAERRVERILSVKHRVTSRLRTPALAGLAAIALPLAGFIATIRPAVVNAQAQASAPLPPPRALAPSPNPPAPPKPGETLVPAPPQPAARPLTGVSLPSPAATPLPAPLSFGEAPVPAPPLPAGRPIPGAPWPEPPAPEAMGLAAPQPLPPEMPSAAAVPLPAPPAPPELDDSPGANVWMESGDEGEAFIIVSGDSTTMSGTFEDDETAKALALRSKIKGDFIWFRRDGKEYIIQDAATVKRAREFFAPEEELGRQQAELGKKQAVLGSQQAELGRRQATVRVKIPDITAQLRQVEEELRRLGATGTQQDLSRIQAELGSLQSRIGEVQSRAGGVESKLAEQQSLLGEQQSSLGEQQSSLGRRQEEFAKQASRQMNQLLDEALKQGVAQPAP